MMRQSELPYSAFLEEGEGESKNFPRRANARSVVSNPDESNRIGGEQPLPPYGSCLLGSLNLTKFVKDPFSDKARFDWDKFRKTVRIFSRMLDNVVEINGLALERQRAEIESKRRHGMGFIGMGSACVMLRKEYGSEAGEVFAEEIAKVMAMESYAEGLALAKEKGAAPIMEELFTVTDEMLRKRPEMEADGYGLGDTVPGRVLWARYSRFMQQIAKEDPGLVSEMAEVGCRYTHATSIAPTGTISLSACNNASNGIEPSFAHHYARNVIVEGKKSKQKMDVFSYELLKYREVVNEKAMPFTNDPAAKLPSYFLTSDDLKPMDHVVMQGAVQKWVDSSISKTVNVPTSISFEDFQGVYMEAYGRGMKGCTTFRFNPEVFQGVLVTEKNLSETTYVFNLGDGETLEAQGNELIEYEGETHTAANLYDSLKEGYYGRL